MSPRYDPRDDDGRDWSDVIEERELLLRGDEDDVVERRQRVEEQYLDRPWGDDR